MTDTDKCYSVLIEWSDTDDEQGEYGAVVRAQNEYEAEMKARLEMVDSYEEQYGERPEFDTYEDGMPDIFGRVIECVEGYNQWAMPDLLAAAKIALPFLVQEREERQTSGNDEDWTDIAAAEAALNAAIAKAEGREE